MLESELLRSELVQLIIALVIFVSAMITVVGPIIRKRLEVWANKKYVELNHLTPSYVDDMLKRAAEIAVIVVEAKNLQGKGEEKLQQAENIAEGWLYDVYGYEIELDRIREAIEFVLFKTKVETPKK